MRTGTIAIALMLFVSTIGAAAAPVAAQQSEAEAYSGAHVEFESTGNAISQYAVNGDVIVENVTVQSASQARSDPGSGFGSSFEGRIDFSASGLDLVSQTSIGVSIQIESGAEMQAHDNDRGIFQVRASEEDQVVKAELAGGSEAESESSKRVVVTDDSGNQGTFIVVGEGEATVDDEGNVVAEVKQDGELVYRQYQGDRSENDEESERMIQNGVATAEVFVQQSESQGEESSQQAQESATHAVEYGQDTSVEVTEQTEDRVDMTVDRSQSQGKVVLATVSEKAIENVQDLQVSVDGNAAAQANSYSAVEQSAQEGDEPRYHVAESASAEGSAQVAIGIDHFSTRNVTMTSGEDGGGDGFSLADGPGFGALGALAALAALCVALVARRP